MSVTLDLITESAEKFQINVFLSDFSIVKHGKLYSINVNFPKLQVEGACEFDVNYRSFLFNESCSFVETFSEFTMIHRVDQI